ncbi:MAG TPA: hypothetical protein IAA10_04175 [Candidatus Blautia intestinavium]|nr:hypothetical protein [Candidatus Blautia intestinavium]
MINKKQFIIAKKKIHSSDYIYVELKNNYILSYHKDLNIYINKQYEIILLGIAWQVKEKKEDPVSEIEKLAEKYEGYIPEEEILRMEESWCGRYVLIVNEKIYLDATGLLGIFYSREGISSSCMMLAEIMGLPQIIYRPTFGFNWLPGPLTQYEQIKRLLPSQIYNYNDQTINSRQLLATHIPRYKDEQERIEAFSELFSNSLHNLQDMFPEKKILIALTGGYDSRTLLALAEYAGIDFDCYTLDHKKISDGDVEIPQKLCKALKKKYTYIPRKKKYSKELEKEYIMHTGGLADDEDKRFYAYGQYRDLVQKYGNIVLLRSSVWETVTNYYQKFLDDKGKLDIESIYSFFVANELVQKSLKSYFEWLEKTKQVGISDCDRFFWEQRNASWLSPIEQSFDIMEDITSLQPVNSRFLISMLADFPIQERRVKKHQDKLIAYVCPELDGIEYAKKKHGINKMIFNRVGKLVVRIRIMGISKTIKTYIKLMQEERNLKKLKSK